MTNTNPKRQPSEPIQAGAVYRLSELQRRMGIERDALRSAKKKGLRIRKLGTKKYVLGDDFIEFMESLPSEEA